MSHATGLRHLGLLGSLVRVWTECNRKHQGRVSLRRLSCPGAMSLSHEAKDLQAPTERKRDEPVVLYCLYRLFREGGCNAVKQWGLFE